MIPVLICPVVSEENTLVRRLIASLDRPVGRIVIVDNTPRHQLDIGVPGVEYIRPLIGLGYPGGLNAGISQTPAAPWWLLVNDDIAFTPGDLARIEGLIGGASTAAVVTGDKSDSRMLRWAYAAVNAETIATVGLMDDWAFFPIYFDDDDYERRCRLAGVDWRVYNGGILHGRDGTVGSETIRRDPRASQANAETFRLNRIAYVEKWGGPPGGELWVTPYGIPGAPLGYTRPSPAKRAARMWETTALAPSGDELR